MEAKQIANLILESKGLRLDEEYIVLTRKEDEVFQDKDVQKALDFVKKNQGDVETVIHLDDTDGRDIDVQEYTGDNFIREFDKSTEDMTESLESFSEYLQSEYGIGPDDLTDDDYDSLYAEWETKKSQITEDVEALEGNSMESLQQQCMDALMKYNGMFGSKEPLHDLFEILVPSSGKASTKAGEMVRAMMHILYRDYNDGDRFYKGYGLEVCGSDAQYLMNILPELRTPLINIASDDPEDDMYTERLLDISETIISSIFNDPTRYFVSNTTDSRTVPVKDIYGFDDEEDEDDWDSEDDYYDTSEDEEYDESLKDSPIGTYFRNAGAVWQIKAQAGDYTLVYSSERRISPWVVAWKLDDDGSWGQGHYFEKQNDAEAYFNKVTKESES